MSASRGRKHYYRLCAARDCTVNLDKHDGDLCKRCQAAANRPKPKSRPPVPIPDWSDAACTQTDPELFFAPEHEQPGGKALREHRARQVCNPCPIREACLEYAVEVRAVGMWGATNDEQRKGIRRDMWNAERRAARAGESA